MYSNNNLMLANWGWTRKSLQIKGMVERKSELFHFLEELQFSFFDHADNLSFGELTFSHRKFSYFS
ncbi:hypothetical protein CWB96_08165 [Pseudoalteromonas citrea]|uniref:Uncharacterized protein n=1 Tax=Pseudoalteromonas citrea TaxID=43655 RepID=A0A5S3XRN8_9GAMM|nr:hypothetical protein CWB97_17685 [Pseudoalteromonas citrea]TMP59907.1 hypothetical protein CWB96_08165 [Pseudoalteromonas citrea]